MTPELDGLLRQLEPATPANESLRLRFGLACVQRVEHLLEDDQVKACLQEFRRMLQAQPATADLARLRERIEPLAGSHPGSRSLDGVGHAAVSATYALAKAIAGQARQAAEYAAYAAVYGHGGYGATLDPSSFEPEDAFLADVLAAMLGERRMPDPTWRPS